MKNVIFILTDDQTINTINYLGNEEIITPNLDNLAKNGTAFSNAHIPSGTSGAVCMPSRAMIHTSKHLFELEDCGNEIPEEHITLGQHLLNNGYNNFACGKWHNGIDGFKKSFNSGDNIFFGGMWDHYNVPVNDFDPSGKYDNKVNFVVNFFNSNEVLEWTANKFNPGVHSTDLLTETSVKFLNEYDEDKPYFLYTSLLAPHDPRVMPRKYKDMYDVNKIKVPENYQEQHEFLFGQQHERDEQLAPEKLTHDYVKQEILDYYAMITHIDYELGKIIDAAQKRSDYEDTIIIFTSDNGLCLGRHGLVGKQNHYEESIKIPFIISGPGIKKDYVIDKYIYLMDIYPTLLDILGIEYSNEISGKSFAKLLLNNDESNVRDNLYFAFTHYIRSVKDDRYKLICYRPEENIEIRQLFDLKVDPYEKNNLINKDEYKKIEEDLYNLLLQYKSNWETPGNKFSEMYWNKL